MIRRKSEGSTNQDLVNVVLQHVQHMNKFAKMVRLPKEFTPTSISLEYDRNKSFIVYWSHSQEPPWDLFLEPIPHALPGLYN